MRRLLFYCISLALGPVASADVPYIVEEVASGFEYPWSVAELDGAYLVTVKPGRLWRVNAASGVRTPIGGVPEVMHTGQGGLLDVLVSGPWVYLSYSRACAAGFTTALSRYRLTGDELVGGEELFSAVPCTGLGYHFGGRLAQDDANMIYLTVGDRYERKHAQHLDSHRGKLIRLNPDGSVPHDNPFVNTAGALPEIYSYGHRNPQGLAKHPERNTIWMHEHGPRGGDELNAITAGANYGWPKVTYGREYSGFEITPLTEAPGMVSPRHHWTPSIAPSGLAIVPTHGAFAAWAGQFLVGALVDRDVRRVRVDAYGLVTETVLPQPRGERIRDVRVFSDGLIYILTDDYNGKLLRLRPQ